MTALLIAFANGAEYGMGACLSPGAKLDDGLLEATVVEDRPALARFIDARHLALRTIARAPRVRSPGSERQRQPAGRADALPRRRGAGIAAIEALAFRLEAWPRSASKA